LSVRHKRFPYGWPADYWYLDYHSSTRMRACESSGHGEVSKIGGRRGRKGPAPRLGEGVGGAAGEDVVEALGRVVGEQIDQAVGKATRQQAERKKAVQVAAQQDGLGSELRGNLLRGNDLRASREEVEYE